MLYVKSVVAGVLAVIVANLICWIPLLWLWLKLTARLPPGSGDSYFVVMHWHTARFLWIAIPAFAAGFYWQYRRAR